MIPKTNLTGFILTSYPKMAQSAICKNDSNPPVRSNMILAIDHPTVDFLL